MLSLEIFIDIILPTALRPWSHTASNKNECQEYFVGKDRRCVGLTNLPLLCADYPEILEHQPDENLRACPGL
jgi:hypothetical protein